MYYKKNPYLLGRVDFLFGEISMPVIDGKIFDGIQNKTGDNIYYLLPNGTPVKTVNLNKIVRGFLKENYSDQNWAINLSADYQKIDPIWIKTYQAEYGISTDGIIGPVTSAALWDSIDTSGQSAIKNAVKKYIDELNAEQKVKDDITAEIKDDKTKSLLEKYGSYAILGISGFAAFVLIMSLFDKKKGK